ncbi:MAG: D-tyrosyl-tRNA(Tyr) deacylase [Verrucomicrobia bacterium]|nr:D-tyrosyl-tRNA(Tyr) deacylase [Verrucomicrobiota bacterium]
MRLLIQRVSQAKVVVAGQTVGEIGKGALVFLGIHVSDTSSAIPWYVNKLVHLRMFHDAEEKMNQSLLDVQGEVLIVSQFTLYGDCTQGRRPSFTEAAPPEKARALYEEFVLEVKKLVKKVETGVFGAHMEVSLTNDGPVSLLIEKKSLAV